MSAGAPAASDGPTDTPASRSSAIDLRGVTAGYRGQPALTDVTLHVPSGAMMAVVGPNGGGKATLLKLLLGMLPLWSGEATVLGQRPAEARKRIGYVPQTGSGDWRFPATVG